MGVDAAASPRAGSTVDPAEVEKFSRIAAEWWNPHGKFRPLHKFNPARLGYIRDAVTAHFRRDVRAPKPLAGLRVLDVGCGGGLVCEPMARLGAIVTGIDASDRNIAVASLHAAEHGLAIDYRAATVEAGDDEAKAQRSSYGYDDFFSREGLSHYQCLPALLLVPIFVHNGLCPEYRNCREQKEKIKSARKQAQKEKSEGKKAQKDRPENGVFRNYVFRIRMAFCNAEQ